MSQATTTVTITNRLGLHARPAMMLVEAASKFDSDVKLTKAGGQTVDAKSIMQVMMLAATQGTQITVAADGPDAEEAVAAIEALVNEGFDEE